MRWPWISRKRRDDDLDQEIQAHLAMAKRDRMERGETPEAAEYAVHREFGNRTNVRQSTSEVWRWTSLERLFYDVRYALRMLRRNPLFSAVALLTLAIGIGANTAVYSVVNGILLKPLPYPNPDELVAVAHSATGAEGLAGVSDGLPLSPSMYFTYSEQNRTFASLGVWTLRSASVTGLDTPEQVRAVAISDGVLQALDVQPAVGRWLSLSDQKPGSDLVVMIGYGYWQRRFGGEASVIGRKIDVDSRPREIVGVMPRSFQLVDVDFDLILPLAFDRSKVKLSGFGFQSIARLKPGATIAEAGTDVARLIPVWMMSWPTPQGVDPKLYETWKLAPMLRPLKDRVVGSVGNVLWILMGTIAIVLLIAAANVANLLLVRAEARQHELAVRAALGAGRGRIVRALLLESTLLGLLGGILGLGFAYAGVRFLVSLGPESLPRLNEIAIDSSALAFTFAVSILSGLLFGLVPAMKYAGPRISTVLRGESRSVSQSRERHRTRNALVVAQVALALVLLVSSGLMIRTFRALNAVAPGFQDPAHIQTMRTSIPSSLVEERERVIRMENDIADRIGAIPGVRSVAFVDEIPMADTGHDWDATCVEGQVLDVAAIPPLRLFKSASPGVFSTLGTRLVAGRDFNWTDLYERRLAVVISENLARELWNEPSNAVGKRIGSCLPGSSLREVIGVVEDIRDNGVQEPAPKTVYWPAYGESTYEPKQLQVARNVAFVIRSDRAGTEGFLGQVQQAVWAVNPSLPLASVRTLQEVYGQSMARTSFALVMLGVASLMALTLGLIGIYGVISYVVSQRRKEIGIRAALGAQQTDLCRMFLRYGLTLTGTGIILGLFAAAGLMQLMKSLLFEISPLDPVTYATVPVALIAAALLASYLPARKAAALDPVRALKED